MADNHDCSSSGLDKGPSRVGQVTDFLSAARELRNRELENDTITNSTGEQTYYSTAPQELWTEPSSKDLQDATTGSAVEHTYYSTAPQELWTQVLSKDLQVLNFVGETLNNEGESSCVEVLLLEPSDLVSKGLLAEGGQAHVFFATSVKLSMPVVVKKLKDVNVDLFRLQRRMERVMKIRKKNNSSICKVLGVGKDLDGIVFVVMEKMVGDLRTAIDQNMQHLGYGQMPFDYNETVAMMLQVAEGMEDLHGCDLIHADLKASNILVYLEPMIGEGLDEKTIPMYFRAKIGDFDTPDGIWGSGFWRAPEVLQALKSGARPSIAPSADIYSYGMLCYELLTGQIPFKECNMSDYNVVISGRRPQLPTHCSHRMKKLLNACWRADPQDRPGWTWIIETLQKEQMLCPLRLNCGFAPESGCRVMMPRSDDMLQPLDLEHVNEVYATASSDDEMEVGVPCCALRCALWNCASTLNPHCYG